VEETTGVHAVTETVRRTVVHAMTAVAVVSVVRGKIVVVAMNVVVQADRADSEALQVADNAQAQAAAVAHQVREVFPLALQVAAVLRADNVVQMIVAPVLMAAAIAVLGLREPIAAQGLKVEIVVLVGKGIVVPVAVTNAGMTGISMIVLASQKVGLCGCCPNHVPWKPFRNKSRHPAGPIPFSMSPNCFFPAGIVICCTSITRNQPVARISQRMHLQLRPLKLLRNCCNARSMVRSG
jgi:hypothetical protein